jgi:hypothetical protein
MEISQSDLELVVEAALSAAALEGGIPTHLSPTGDFYVKLTHEGGQWRIRVCDAHGGLDYADVTRLSLFAAVVRAQDDLRLRLLNRYL